MWLKELISRYSQRISFAERPAKYFPVWEPKKHASPAQVESLFRNEVMMPLVKHLNEDLSLDLRCVRGQRQSPSFCLLDNNGEVFGTVYMANPMNGRAFFRFPNGMEIEMHSYRSFLEQLQCKQEKQETNDTEIRRKPRGFRR